jgi:streptomycin 6-kinase
VTGALTLPANLVGAADRSRSDRLRDWIGRLPGIVADLAERWQLQPGEPFQPGGETAWVAAARRADGADLVLKVGWAHPEGESEADGLRAWAGDGTVLLHAHHREGDTTALLLERCRPGTGLGQAMTEEEQDEVVAGLVRRLWREPSRGHPFRPLREMCDDWADQYEAAPNPRLDPGVGRAGVALFRSLPRDAHREVLLATDLHAGNVLAAEREPWLVIDPKPYVGDPAYDPLQHLLNCPGRLTADPSAVADRMADLCGVERERLRLWLFARCVVESWWWPAAADVARRLAPR